MAVGYASFTALYNYSPTATDEIELRVGDVILVKRPFDSEGLQTWLEGVNQRTKQCGQIPGPYLKEVAGIVNLNERRLYTIFSPSVLLSLSRSCKLV